MDTETLVNEAVGSLPPQNDATPSSQGPMQLNDKPNSPPNGSDASSKTLIGCLSERNSREFRQRFLRMDETHPKASLTARWAEAWIKAAATNDKDSKGRWVVFAGRTGCGKTHALRASYEFLRAVSGQLWPLYHSGPVNVGCYRWSRIVSHGPLSWNDIEEEARTCRILLLDDVGSEADRFRSGEPAERLRSLLEIAAPKWLLMTTNILRKDFGKAFDARVQSRLERAQCLDLGDAEDYRTRVNA